MNTDEIKKDAVQRLNAINRDTRTKLEELGETLRVTLVIPLCKKYGMTYLSARGGQFHNGTDWILSFNDTNIPEIREALNILSFYVGSDTIHLAYYVKDVTKEDTTAETL